MGDETTGSGNGFAGSASFGQSSRAMQHWSTHLVSQPALGRSFYPANSTFNTLPRK